MWNHYREALKLIQMLTIELSVIKAKLNITDDDFPLCQSQYVILQLHITGTRDSAHMLCHQAHCARLTRFLITVQTVGVLILWRLFHVSTNLFTAALLLMQTRLWTLSQLSKSHLPVLRKFVMII